MTSRRRRVDQHRQPLDPRRPADRRRVRPAELLDQAVIAAAGDHRALRAKPVGDELERGVAVIIEPAHQVRVELVGDAGRVEPGADLAEEILRLGRQESSIGGACRRSAGRAGPCCRGCAAGSSRAAPGCPRDRSARWAAKCSTSAAAPRVAAGGIAQRVELQRRRRRCRARRAAATPRASSLDVGLRLGGADDLGVELVELAEAALLRPLVAEGRAVGRDLQRRDTAASLRSDRRGRCRR